MSYGETLHCAERNLVKKEQKPEYNPLQLNVALFLAYHLLAIHLMLLPFEN